METEGIVDIGKGIYMFALQYVYAPRLEVDLQAWANSHNHHGVRTENFKNPLQMWYAGSIQNEMGDFTAMHNFFRCDTDDVGLAVNKFLIEDSTQEPNDIAIVLPRYTAPLLNIQLEELKRTINPPEGSSYDGADLYVNTAGFIENCTLQRNFAT